MTIELDHLILPVTDIRASVAFYRETLGLEYEPDALLHVGPSLVIQLMQHPPATSQHLAFSISSTDFNAILERLKTGNVPFGDNFDTMGNMSGPGTSHGSKKNGHSIYFKDPDGHMLEIMYYE